MAFKPISDFPRPPFDNGRGIHWSASVYHLAGADLQYWIDELHAMEIKWVKLLDDSGGSSVDMCRVLLDNGIMPIVRLYREYPNPGHLGGREIETLPKFIDAGVTYFEANNEPDLPAEWKNGHRPSNWLNVVVDNFILDADIILDAGGLPALPAMGAGGKHNAFSMVLERGRKDIFERGAWAALHNYTLNHPLDYPSDPVNQRGEPITQEEFDWLAAWQYSHLTPEEAEQQGVSRDNYDKFQRWAWDGRSIDMVNQLRAEAKNPGDTIFDDASCFRGWQFIGNMIYETLGFHIPVISTEGGPVVGWGDDQRYAKVNPTTQANMQMDIFRFLQDEAPPWYFTCCTWLLATKPFGDFNPTGAQMAWHTDVWNLQFGLQGQLPIVQLLKDTSSEVRHELRPLIGEPGMVKGMIRGREDNLQPGIALTLREEAETIASTTSDAEGGYKMQAPAGQYDLWVEWVGPVAHDITLTEGDVDIIDVEDIDPVGEYDISCTVQDAQGRSRSGLEVELRRNAITHAAATTDDAGVVLFSPGIAGRYVLSTVDGGTSAVVSPEESQTAVEIVLSESQDMRYYLTEKRLLPPGETANRREFYGYVTDSEGIGINDIELEMRWMGAEPDTSFPRTRTGKDRSRPDPNGYFEFLHSPGEFMIVVVEEDHESDVADKLLTADVPGREGDPITYEVNFQLRHVVAESPASSIILGSIPGGRTEQVVRLWSGSESKEAELGQMRRFRFGDLSAGVYDLELAGIGVIRADLVLDGSNQIEVDFPLMGAMIGQVLDAPPNQHSITLISESYGFTRQGDLTPENNYRFTNLPPGIYRIELDDAILAGLVSDGLSVLQAPPLLVELTYPTGNSQLSGVVFTEDQEPLPGVAVALLYQNHLVTIAITDHDGRYEFVGLGAGMYALMINGAVVASHLSLDGDTDLVANLRYATDVGPSTKPISHYYLIGMADPALRSALVRLLASWFIDQPDSVIGFNTAEAEYAAVVTVLGDGVSEETMSALQTAGCQVIDRRQDLVTLAEILAGAY